MTTSGQRFETCNREKNMKVLLKKIGKLAAGAATGGLIGGGGAVSAEFEDIDSAIIAIFTAIGGAVTVYLRDRKAPKKNATFK